MSEDPDWLTAGLRVITGGIVCRAIQATLEQHLPAWAAAFELGEMVRTWDQVVDAKAITSAQLPTGLIACPGITTTPPHRVTAGRHRWDATWRIGVGVYDRADSFTGATARGGTWAAAVRTVILQHPTLGGLAKDTRWVGEDYAPLGAGSGSRTFAQCAVAFDVDVEDVTPPTGLQPTPDGQGPVPQPPTALTVHPQLTIR